MSNFAAIGFGDGTDDTQRLILGAVQLARPAAELGALAAPDHAASATLADVWLVGRACEPPPMPEPRGWLKKLVGV